ncbi:MAG TPA: response regulator [Saprospiraceae bacterium]|nr:response regulator [Saprospiraceae bacterium]HPI04952.1 response regulator [Saprospiraceae bacterium]
MTSAISFFLVDDDLDDTMLFEDVVNDCEIPIQLWTAQDGKEALDMLRNHPSRLPQALFLDLNMPRMDGKECLAELKTDDRLANIPVIIYTTSSHSKDLDETMALGAVGFITKPTDMKDLEKIVQTIAENSPHNLENALRYLRSHTGTFIAC